MKRHGFTALELLIAMAILGIVLVLASQGIITGLNAKRSQENVIAAQEKTRRVSQVISQDVRGSIFGALVNTPYVSGTKNVSFLLLDGGAGYNVTSNTTNGYIISSNATNASSLGLSGGKVLVVSQDGKAFLYSVTSVSGSGNQYTVSYTGCSNAIAVNGDTLMFRVSTVGFRWDAATNTIFRQVNNNPEEAVAFDVVSQSGNNQYDVDYIYEAADGSIDNQPAPYKNPAGVPLTKNSKNGKTYTLARLQFGIGVQATGFNRQQSKKDITTTIELKEDITNQRFRSIQEGVILCS
jgi:prepilin-type N-terminal cleavage/methylation domain-containing protein